MGLPHHANTGTTFYGSRVGDLIRVSVGDDGRSVIFEHIRDGHVISRSTEAAGPKNIASYVTVIDEYQTTAMGFPAPKPILAKVEEMKHEAKARARAVLGPKKARWK
jgi:hypothetical protein